MYYLRINNCNFKKYKVFLNNHEIRYQDELINTPLDNNGSKLTIVQKNIVDLFVGKSLVYKIFFGFFIAIAEGLGGEALNDTVIGSGYSRAKYEALIIPEKNEDVEINVCLKQKKKIFIPIGKYFFELNITNGKLKDIISSNKSNKEDKVLWYTIFSIPIIISVIALIFVVASLYNIIR